MFPLFFILFFLIENSFRSSKNEYYPKKFANFVDGDLILKFFSLSKEEKAEISSKLEMPVSDILRILERLQRTIL